MNIARLTTVLACALLIPASRAASQAMGQTINGISCDAQEGQRIHIHQHLAIFDHGKAMTIPQFIGIPRESRCIYWLHTHTPDGIIHIEAPMDRSFTLGDFFAVWGQPLDRTHAAGASTKKSQSMRVWLNGKPYSGNPATIPLTAHADIVIQVGPPFTKPVPYTKWGAL
ncbi:MAG TPA: hypothetical protein VGH98_24405 [Gemmatimonadaceae bacterium]|jgi:hypothetical protein